MVYHRSLRLDHPAWEKAVVVIFGDEDGGEGTAPDPRSHPVPGEGAGEGEWPQSWPLGRAGASEAHGGAPRGAPECDSEGAPEGAPGWNVEGEGDPEAWRLRLPLGFSDLDLVRAVAAHFGPADDAGASGGSEP